MTPKCSPEEEINLDRHKLFKLAGNSTMGWLNPFLHKKSSSFVNDITVGHNNCTNNNSK
jgi:hypothetical protein